MNAGIHSTWASDASQSLGYAQRKWTQVGARLARIARIRRIRISALFGLTALQREVKWFSWFSEVESFQHYVTHTWTGEATISTADKRPEKQIK